MAVLKDAVARYAEGIKGLRIQRKGLTEAYSPIFRDLQNADDLIYIERFYKGLKGTGDFWEKYAWQKFWDVFYSRHELILIYATGKNGVIGNEGDLPWTEIEGDLPHFKNETMSSDLVMGSKTFASLPDILEGRRHIVLTSIPRDMLITTVSAGLRRSSKDSNQINRIVESITAQKSLMECLSVAKSDKVYVIGGAQTLASFEPYATRAIVTEVEESYVGDAFFRLSGDWGKEGFTELSENASVVEYKKSVDLVSLQSGMFLPSDV